MSILIANQEGKSARVGVIGDIDYADSSIVDHILRVGSPLLSPASSIREWLAIPSLLTFKEILDHLTQDEAVRIQTDSVGDLSLSIEIGGDEFGDFFCIISLRSLFDNGQFEGHPEEVKLIAEALRKLATQAEDILASMSPPNEQGT